jgi:RNA polymerase sigma-70 factor (ECF subfamily)
MISFELKRELFQAVDTLPENYRAVLILIYQQGLSTKEAAKVLETSPANVKTTSYRALSKLREVLEKRNE